MSASQKEAAQKELTNKADHILIFEAALPVGLATFRATAAAAPPAVVEAAARRRGGRRTPPRRRAAAAADGGRERHRLVFDGASGLLSTITNRKSGATTSLAVEWGWYNSSVGGCTAYGADVPVSARLPPCDDQKSGAYMFRPNSSELFFPGARSPVTPTLEVIEGPVVTEVRQAYSGWTTHVIRLHAGQPYVELEWTAGPIPIDTPWYDAVATNGSAPLPNVWGKEVVVRYSSGLKSAGA